MALRTLVYLVACMAPIAGGFALQGQPGAGPTDYTVTASSPSLGIGGMTKIFRLGQWVLIDQSGTPREVAGASHTLEMRTLYDLAKKESLTWDPVHESATCVKGMFSEWGDPFGGATALTRPEARPVGGETVDGFATRIVESSAGAKGTLKTWVDGATGLVVKQQLTPPGGAPQLLMEVTNVSLKAPDAAEFAVPASCGEVAGAPQAPSVARRQADPTAALVGGDAKNYVSGLAGPASKNACTMAFRVVRAGTMEPVTDGLQVGVDLKLATETNPHYTIGAGENGKATFAGGGLHELKAEGQSGVFRVENVPESFEIDLEFGPGGATASKVYRQCFAPQTVLLFVVKDPANLDAGGGWLWVKAGKCAAVPR
jgi:hypothetical protein